MYEFKITLLDVGAPVWRKVHIDKQANFFEFHELIQAAFDWTSSHLYDFNVLTSNGEAVRGVEISGNPEEFNMHGTEWVVYEDDTEIIANWFTKPHDCMRYTYDYGDNWEHDIEFIREVEADETTSAPYCVAAKNYAPPEDSRFELIQGQLHLIAENNQLLLEEINDNIKDWSLLLEEMELGYSMKRETAVESDASDNRVIRGLWNTSEEDEEVEDLAKSIEEKQTEEANEWELTLQQAKVFLQAKPWKKLREQDIFAISDPFTGRYLFCSVLGDGQENIGVTAYYGVEGFLALLDSLSGETLSWDHMQQQQSLFLTFEDREDLEQADYDLIKSHRTDFRGKKSWPEFTSFKPGYLPWIMTGNEIQLIRFVMTETLAVVNELEQGQELPDISREKILLRQMDETVDGQINFSSTVANIDDLLHGEREEELALSEIEIKRLSKMSKILPFSIEFSIMPLDVPVQKVEGERPSFPLLAVAADTESSVIYYQEMFENELDAYFAQKTLLDALIQIGGVPEMIIADQRTARFVLPLLDVHDMDIQIKEHLEIIDFILEDMYDFISDE